MISQLPARTGLLLCLFLLLLSACANFLQPETGAVARPEARIAIPEQGVRDQAFENGDVTIACSLSSARDPFNMSGTINFSDSLTNAYPILVKFILKMSFLDGDGKVIETLDITPVMNYYGQVKTADFRFSRPAPPGSKAIAFNWFGIFRQTGKDNTGEWEISYFPYQ